MTDDAECDAASTAGNERSDQDPSPQPIGKLERAATGVSGLLIVFLVSVLLWHALHPETPPAFDSRPGRIVAVDTSYRVTVTVFNTGGQSAKAVVLHLALRAADSTVAETDLTIDWLPGRSRREAVGLFSPPSSPRWAGKPLTVRADVRGYLNP